MGDRGGGRESKGGSLRKTKIHAAEAAKAAKAKPREEKPTVSPAPPPITLASLPPPGPSRPPLALDAAANLISRQFDRDREAVIRRARQAGVAALVLASSDYEKQEEVLRVARAYPGTAYAAVGVHPDCVRRTNDKQMAAHLAAVRELGLAPETVALQSGLNLTRDPATHYAQERLLEMHVALAAEIGLPLLLHLSPGSAARAAELLAAAPARPRRVAVVNALPLCGGDEDAAAALAPLLELGAVLLVSGAGLSEQAAEAAAAAGAAARALRAAGAQLLPCTCSPQHTPQSIPDEYLRTLRNEPSNLPWVRSDLARAAGEADADETWRLALELFDLRVAVAQEAPPPGAQPAAAAARRHAEPARRPAGGAPAIGSAAEAADEEEEEEAVQQPTAVVQRGAFASLAADEDEEEGSEAEEESEESSGSEDAPTGGLAGGGRYACGRCRCLLWRTADVLHHSVMAPAERRHATDENVCIAHVFVPVGGGDGGDCAAALAQLGVSTHDGGGEGEPGGDGDGKAFCAACGAKLGRFSHAALPCACGVLVAGPVLVAAAARVDVLADVRHMRELLGAVALRDAYGADAGDAPGPAAQPGAAPRRRRRKLVREGKGNFSEFRNKKT